MRVAGRTNHVTMRLRAPPLLPLLLLCLHQFGLYALQYDHEPSSLCKVSAEFESPLVSAHLEQNVPGRGCVTNLTILTTGQQVHAISYHSDKTQDVQLYLKDLTDTDFHDPLIIVLTSNVRVVWQVRMKRNPRNLAHHTILVSKGSGIRFANKRIENKPKINKHRDIPNDSEELLSWLLDKYGIVTSLSTFDHGTSVHLNIGIDSSVTKATSAAPQTHCVVQRGDELPLTAYAIVEESRPLDGCVVAKRKDSFAKHAYVVELKQVSGTRPFEVDLEIRRQSRQTVDKEFWLVLKSPGDVTWRVHTRKVQGYINIVANSFVDMAGIRMHTVAVRSEELRDSGIALLQWVEYFLGPVALYAQVNDTNRVRVTLPQTAERKSQPKHRPESELPINPPESEGDTASTQRTKLVLKRAMSLECSEGSVIVAISKLVLKMLGINKDMISLLEPQCRAVDNKTHVYIHSSGSSCGTNFIDNGHGQLAFINTLVVHSYSVTEEVEERLEDPGSGLNGDVFSGSGAGPGVSPGEGSDVYLDDEDMKAVPLQISFMCEVDNTRVHQPQQKDVSFQLGLYTSILFESAIARFPMLVPSVHSQLYLQALVTSNPTLRANIRSCWLSRLQEKHDEKKYFIVENGCAADSSVSWHRNLPTKFGGVPQSQRLSFTMEYYTRQVTSHDLAQGTRPQLGQGIGPEPQQGTGPETQQGTGPVLTTDVYLKCYLSACCIEENCGDSIYPACVDARDWCEHRRHKPHHIDSPNHLVIIGPIRLPPPTNVINTVYKPLPDEGTPKVDVEVATSSPDKVNMAGDRDPLIIQGLDSGTVVGIAFAAFIIGVLMMGALWFIHTHSGAFFVSGPFKRSLRTHGSTDNENDYGETTPGSSAPIST